MRIGGRLVFMTLSARHQRQQLSRSRLGFAITVRVGVTTTFFLTVTRAVAVSESLSLSRSYRRCRLFRTPVSAVLGVRRFSARWRVCDLPKSSASPFRTKKREFVFFISLKCLRVVYLPDLLSSAVGTKNTTVVTSESTAAIECLFGTDQSVRRPNYF